MELNKQKSQEVIREASLQFSVTMVSVCELP